MIAYVFHVLTAHPVHKADIRQHEEVDLHKKPSLCRRIRRHTPDGDSKAMQEAHVERAWRLCRDVGVYRLPQRRTSSAYNMNWLYPRLCMLCLSRRKALAPMQPWCSVIVAAVALPGRSRSQGFAGGQRSTPHRVDRHGGVVEIPDCNEPEQV